MMEINMDGILIYLDTLRISTVLIFTLTMICSIWLGQFHWRRRVMYRMADKIPGPSGYPLIGIIFEFLGNLKYINRQLFRIFEEYDPIARCWFAHKLCIMISKPEHYQIVLNSPHCMEKNFLYSFISDVVGTGLLCAPLTKWKKNRKIIAPTFNPKILNSFVDVFAEHSEVLVDQLKQFVGKEITDIHNIFTATVLDIICETAMGIKVDVQKTGSEFGKWADTILSIVFARMLIFYYHADALFNCTSIGRKFWHTVGKMHGFTGRVVAEKKKEFEQNIDNIGNEDDDGTIARKPFLDTLLQISYDGAEFTDQELREDVDLICIGGSDTTALTMSFCLSMLGIHQDLQQKVYEEAIDVLNDRPATAEDLPRLKYLERVVKETLRLFPPIPFIVRASEKYIQLDEYVIPANSSIVLGFLHTQRSPKYWDDPMKFDPDRYLQEKASKRHPYAFCTFSGGPRDCIGQRYSMMILKGLLSAVIRKYKIFCEYKSVVDIDLKSKMTLRPTDGFKVSMQERELV